MMIMMMIMIMMLAKVLMMKNILDQNNHLGKTPKQVVIKVEQCQSDE